MLAYISRVSACQSKIDEVIHKLDEDLSRRASELAKKYFITAKDLSCFSKFISSKIYSNACLEDWGCHEERSQQMETIHSLSKLRGQRLSQNPQQILEIFEVLVIFSEHRALWLVSCIF